ncbi:tripartite tricarboxylate transporter permease [Pelagibius sp.]|uniref:tripartite tricarboxylate transporter permease n=1 Tax=Pelagibius sp. TaxID=1931238 RepID=UPI003BB1B072
MLESLVAALSPLNLALALCGVLAGTVIGALPGLSATMAVAVLVPFTFTMDPASGLIALGAVYTGAIYGGAYAAILVNTPGTPAAIATAMDGFPMAKRGDGDLAVTLSCLASVVGGLVGALALLFLAPPLSQIALAFGPVEYFWLAIFGLSLIATLSAGHTLMGIIGGCIGLLLSTVGSAVVGGDVRYTFGQTQLLGGIPIIPAMIGLYCIPVLIDLVIRPEAHLERRSEQMAGFRLIEALGKVWRSKFNLVRSAVIGTAVGILPAAGGSVAGLVAYTEAKRTSRESKDFGKGATDGVIASEAANSATVGALLVQGIRTGPQLFTQQGDIVYTFVIGLIIATMLMLPTGLVVGRYAFRLIISVPKTALAPGIALLTVIGSYAIEVNTVHVLMMVGLGLVGWVLARIGLQASPIVLGLILGPIAEAGFVQAWLIGGAQGNIPAMFFGRPISLAIIALTLLTLGWPFIAAWRAKRKAAGAT